MVFRETTIVIVTLRVDECIFGIEVYTLDRTMTTLEPCLSVVASSDVTVSRKSPCAILSFPHHSSISKQLQQLICSQFFLLSVISCTRIVSVGPHPTIEALFETKHNCKNHNKDGNSTTNSPEVALRLIRIGDALKVHSEV